MKIAKLSLPRNCPFCAKDLNILYSDNREKRSCACANFFNINYSLIEADKYNVIVYEIKYYVAKNDYMVNFYCVIKEIMICFTRKSFDINWIEPNLKNFQETINKVEKYIKLQIFS